MADVRSFSDVGSRVDLAALYEALDRNHDGRLHPAEDGIEQEWLDQAIKGGGDQDQDGAIAYWEAMALRPQVFDEVEGLLTKLLQLALSQIPHEADAQVKLTETGVGVFAGQHPIIIEGTRYKSVKAYFKREFELIQDRELAEEVRVAGFRIPKGAIMLHARTLGSWGVTNHVPALQFPFASHQSRYISSGDIEKGGLRLYQLDVDHNRQPTGGVLALEVRNPYENGHAYHSNQDVELFQDGTIREDSVECLRAHFPWIALSGHPHSGDIAFAVEGLLKMSPRLSRNIERIHFTETMPGRASAPEASEDESLGAVVDDVIAMNRILYIKTGARQRLSKSFGGSEAVFAATVLVHESAHLHHRLLKDQTARRIQQATQDLDRHSLLPMDFPGRDSLMAAEIAEAGAVTRRIYAQGFEGRWLELTGGRIGTTTTTTFEGPSDGFVRPYGRKSLWEDVATQVEVIVAMTEVFRDLLDPGSKFYRVFPEQLPYVGTYRAKARLLREYGFITEQQYRAVSPVAPNVAAFCSTVNCP